MRSHAAKARPDSFIVAATGNFHVPRVVLLPTPLNVVDALCSQSGVKPKTSIFAFNIASPHLTVTTTGAAIIDECRRH